VLFYTIAAVRRNRNKLGPGIVADILLLVHNLALFFMLTLDFYFIGKYCYLISFILPLFRGSSRDLAS
jgi:hypothetical protein